MLVKRALIISALILSLVLSACSPAQPAAASQPAASGETDAQVAQTSAPVVDDWAAVKAAGVLKVGAAGDYAPFSFYNAQGHLDGFDVALANEAAKRLGLRAEIADYAFEGLPATLLVRQTDVVFAALSMTTERLQIMDFSSVYYTGSDGILANRSSNLTSVNSVDQLVGKRIGVQRGSVYEEWIKSDLVNTGRLPASQLFAYVMAFDAINDLKANKLDLLIMDLAPAKAALSDQALVLAGYGLYPQNFAAGLRKGSTLTAQVNRALNEIIADGTMNQLIEKYMGIEQPAPIPTQAPPPPPAQCLDAMQYIMDLNYDDQNMTNPPVMKPGEAFTKSWRIKNIGTCTWNSSYYLGFAYGNVAAAQMSGQPSSIGRNVAPGETVDISVYMIAPQQPGAYQGFWNMHNSASVPFGSTLWVGIRVKGQQPPVSGAPVISAFYFDPASVKVNNCSNVYWQVVGDVNKVQLLDQRQNVVWNNAPASGNYQVCPNSAGRLTYMLKAKGPGGSDSRQTNLDVNSPAASRPSINLFHAVPAQVTIPNCSTLQWSAVNTTYVLLYQDGVQVTQGGSSGSYQFCPNQTKIYKFRLVARNSSDLTDEARTNVTVNPRRPEPR